MTTFNMNCVTWFDKATENYDLTKDSLNSLKLFSSF